MADSKFIAKRIKKVYGREAEVIYPPVDVDGYTLCEAKEDFYLTASRMVPYKKMKLIVEAFNEMPDKKLVVIGTGPEFAKTKAIAGANVEMMGYQPFDVLKEKMQKAKAFVFAAEEDFGITPVEAQACGTPVIAYGKGGAQETVRGLDEENPTGLFFESQTVASIVNAVNRFEQEGYNITANSCRKNAEKFSTNNFSRDFGAFVSKIICT